MSDRLLTYDELAAALGRSPEAVRQLAKRKRWRRIISNDDGKARVVVPVEVLEALRSPDVQRATDRPASERPLDDRLDTRAETTGDARTLVVMLQARVTELDADLREARADLKIAQATITELTATAARVVGLEIQLGAEKARTDDLKAERDRWAAQAERVTLAPPQPRRRSWWPFRRSA
jgi:hypothetical protein